MKVERILLIVVSVLLIIMLFKSCGDNAHSKELMDEYKNIYTALNDTVSHYINQKDQLESKIGVLMTRNTDLFIETKIQNEGINALQEEVRRWKSKLGTGSVTRIETLTKIDTFFQTDTIIQYLSEVRNDSIILYPEYGIRVQNEWVDIEGNVNHLTSTLSIEFENKYSVAIVKKKKWKEEYDVVVTNENPYTSVQDIKAYKVSSPKPKRFGIGLQLGYGFTSSFKPAFYIGAGLSYNILKF